MTLLLLTTMLAFADIAPPPGFIESCTVAKVQTAQTSCVTCKAWYGGHEDCDKLKSEGYAKACRTSGASTWTEVMCKAKPGAKPEETPNATPSIAKAPPEAVDGDGDGGCNTSGAPSGVWVMLALLAVRRRR
jgi:uncharacterized protein (TIGR03382 family)